MAVNLPPLGDLLPIDGIELGTAAAGIRYQDRNEACPCGSGKKYKHCCGKVA